MSEIPKTISLETEMQIVPENLVGFNQLASEAVLEFNALYANGMRTRDGVVAIGSLAATQAGLLEKAKSDPALAGLLEIVSAPKQDETPHDTKSRILTFLKVSGGTVAKQKSDETTSLPTSESRSSPKPNQARKFGHQILADGHVVDGFLGSRPNEVVTSEGILRTRGTSRLSNN